MSYLDPLRLHFAGRFQAAISTVNNDPTHFNNATFVPAFQEFQDQNNANGWFNPIGDAAWRLIGCRVTAAWRKDGTPADTGDGIHQCLVADSDRQVCAKLVDLDSEQQLVSEIWGLEVRICDAQGNTLLRGQFEPAAFMDIWDRATGGSQGDVGAGAMYQSVLTNLEWGAIHASPFLQELRASASEGMLSIKFNVDGFNLDVTSAEFMRGRIVGSIGPYHAGEPRHFVNGRQFLATPSPAGNFFTPLGQINFCVGVVDHENGKVLLDLGNALPTPAPGAELSNIGALSLVCHAANSTGGTTPLTLGDIPYTNPNWYETTAGVAALPANRRLTAQEMNEISAHPLALVLQSASVLPASAISEFATGAYVRADTFVFRLEAGETADVALFATRFGQPYPHANIEVFADPSQLQSAPVSNTPSPPVATPASAIKFPSQIVTNAQGTAHLAIQTQDPGNPRIYIDGQVYGVRALLQETVPASVNYPQSQYNFISILLWDDFKPQEPITWYGSMQPLFQQYANLYPVMKRLMDLGSYADVCDNRGLLELVFSLEPANANSMPVTRDLSAAKRNAILRWLQNVGADGNPLRGEPPPASVMEMAAAPNAAIAPPSTGSGSIRPEQGGKAAAARRRLALNGKVPVETSTP